MQRVTVADVAVWAMIDRLSGESGEDGEVGYGYSSGYGDGYGLGLSYGDGFGYGYSYGDGSSGGYGFCYGDYDIIASD